jgi:hypothetical protein
LNPSTKAKFHLADALRYISQTLFETAVLDDPEPLKPGSPAHYAELARVMRGDEYEDRTYETEDYD